MKIVLFCHPPFLGSQSMERFAQMLAREYRQRGFEVDMWAPSDRLHRHVKGSRWAKWAGYVDQYVLFPIRVRRMLRERGPDTIYAFCDQALGPWVPLVRHLPHVVHAHDLLALRSALGHVPENPTGFTGRLYQRYIRWGFGHGRHFISISNKTRSDLQEFGLVRPVTSAVVYNGLNYPFCRMPADEALRVLREAGMPAEPRGMVLHVGGSVWYKNTAGVVRMYGEYARQHANPLPLWMISKPPTEAVKQALAQLPPQAKVLFFQGVSDQALHAAYSLARAFLFPSLAEGFGWPIVESQACGCPVITTDEAPMNEVGGPAALYVPRLKSSESLPEWAAQAGHVLNDLLAETATQREARMQQGLGWAARFNANTAIDGYLDIYKQVFASEAAGSAPKRR